MRRWFQKTPSLNKDKDSTTLLDWNSVRHEAVQIGNRQHIVIGGNTIYGKSITIVEFDREIPVHELTQARKKYGGSHPLDDGFSPQFAAIVYDAVGDSSAMSMYFPILEALNDLETADFHDRINGLMKSPNLDLRVHRDNQSLADMPPSSIGYIVVGHIVEVFFWRPDLLRCLFLTPRRFDIYMAGRTYAQDGGVAGGCYDPRTESIKLVASRLFEGFFTSRPGVAPFIHEFGHMLDHFDVKSASMKSPNGLFPGMAESDGSLFSYEAQEAFLRGKRLELTRYRQAQAQYPNKEDIPIGHPYVFQNDGEFLAGYLEMFFRNPNYFHNQNPTLYAGFQMLFQQDPRDYMREDFMHYVNENQAVYLGHRNGIQPPGLKVL